MENPTVSEKINGILENLQRNKYWINTPGMAFSNFATTAVLFDRLENTYIPMYKSWTDGPQDGGFDGILITINKVPINSVEDLRSAIRSGVQTKVKFVFIQSKYKSHFSSNDWKAFSSSIMGFFSNTIDRELVNSKVKNFLEILDALKELKKNFNLKFVIHAVIVSMAEKLINPEIENYQEMFTETILRLAVADSVKFHYYGSCQLLALYETRGNVIRRSKAKRRYNTRAYRIVA